MAVKPTPDAKAGDESADLAQEIAALRADLERLTASLGDLAQGRAAGLLDALHARMQGLGGAAETLAKDKLAGAEATLDEVADYARRKPLHALAFAAGAGMVLGLLFGRR